MAQIDRIAIITAKPTRIVLALNGTLAIVEKSSKRPMQPSTNSPETRQKKFIKINIYIKIFYID